MSLVELLIHLRRFEAVRADEGQVLKDDGPAHFREQACGFRGNAPQTCIRNISVVLARAAV